MTDVPTTPAEPVVLPIDVTDELRAAGHLTGEDWNPEDRVFTFGGSTIKVKTIRDLGASATGSEVFRVSGSDCTATGKARTRPDGSPSVHSDGLHLVWQADGPGDLVAAIEALRHQCVLGTIRAAKNAKTALTLVGVADAMPARPTEGVGIVSRDVAGIVDVGEAQAGPLLVSPYLTAPTQSPV